MRITNIKFDLDKTKIKYETQLENGKWKEFQISDPSEPLPVFENAMQNLKEEVCIISEMDMTLASEPEEGEKPKMKVLGFTLTYKKADDYKVSITAYKPVELSNSPVIINTPVVSLGNLKEEDKHFNFKLSMKNKIEMILKLAENYANGDCVKPDQESMKFVGVEK